MRKKLFVALKSWCFVSLFLFLVWATVHTGDAPTSRLELQREEEMPKLPTTNAPFTCKSLLLFAYMRSGSTATGNLLRDSAGVFFMFEPLSPLAPYSYFTHNSICEMRNGTCRSKNVAAQIKESLVTMVNLFNCKMGSVPKAVLDKMAGEKKSGMAWDQYGRCVNNSRPLNQTRGQTGSRSKKALQICLRQLEDACRTAEIRIAKVLRLGFTTVPTILENVSNMKVLFLARDPRAIINSRIKTDWFPVYVNKPKTVYNNTLSLCQKMETDIQGWKKTNEVHGDRILHTTLKQLSSGISPMLNMFKFINKTVTSVDESNIVSVLCKGEKKNIADQWHYELSVPYRGFAEEHCGSVIKHTSTMDGNVTLYPA